MFTFPGGVAEPSDADLRVTALRELFEETGLLLLRDQFIRDQCKTSRFAPNAAERKKWREMVHSDAQNFTGAVCLRFKTCLVTIYIGIE